MIRSNRHSAKYPILITFFSFYQFLKEVEFDRKEVKSIHHVVKYNHEKSDSDLILFPLRIKCFQSLS